MNLFESHDHVEDLDGLEEFCVGHETTYPPLPTDEEIYPVIEQGFKDVIINGQPTGYEVSHLGCVRHKKSGNYVEPSTKDSKGVKWKSKVGISKFGTQYLARIVATAHCHNPNPEVNKEVIHLDGDWENCEAGNLLWVSTASRKALLGKRAKFSFFNPEGEIVETNNLSKFCKELGLDLVSMTSLSNGFVMQYQGYKLNDPQKLAEGQAIVSIRTSMSRLANLVGSKAPRFTSKRECEEAVGYTVEELIERIASQFEEGMSWENRDAWHIDHIIPVCQFAHHNIFDLHIVNALDNLQPLWAKDNLSKSGKFVSKEEFDNFLSKFNKVV